MQPPSLQANAGEDTEIYKGEYHTLGGDPTASEGYGDYIYLWSPAAGLNDPTLANPKATPDVSTTYFLTVTDANNCSVTDEVSISVDASGIDMQAINISILCYPNPVEDELFIEMSGKPAEIVFRLISPIGKELAYLVKKMTGYKEFEKIPMKDLPPGIFYLQIITSETTTYQTIIKTR